tara:strand:+ start:218 stop:1522 length:1305 start_codon:yes stop_codon:yes gene_type:complete
MFAKLLEKINKKNFSVSIIGLGYVGLPLSLLFAKNGIKTIGIDIDPEKINLLKKGQSYIKHIDAKLLNSIIKNGNFIPTTYLKEISNTDAIIICLPTPLNKYKEPDLSYLHGILDNMKMHIRRGQLISLESTTYPGTTEELIKPLIINRGFTPGEDFFVVYSPEREDPGNKKYSTDNIPKVVGGLTKNCSKIGLEFYKSIIQTVHRVSTTKVAEMTKLLENIHRCINISLMNELKTLCIEMDIDIYEVINAAKTKPFGFTPYYPGPGLGGHCIPIDPFYLTWKAKEYNMSTKFIELAGEINSEMPNFVIKRTVEALNKECKSIKNSKILILGLSYKKNIDDTRESPALEIIKILLKNEALVDYSDPFFPTFPKTRKLSLKTKSISINKKNLNQFDLVILVTNHDSYDYELIHKESKLIVDTRGIFPISSKVVSA